MKIKKTFINILAIYGFCCMAYGLYDLWKFHSDYIINKKSEIMEVFSK